MRPSILLISMASVMVASVASAEECDPNDQTQMGMNICAAQDYAASDAKLNVAYGDIMKRLSDNAGARKLLQDSQRAWIAFRDAECKFASSGVEGGSVQPMIHSGCLQGLTDARVTQLDSYLKCEEGDLSCPVPGQ
ncbi:urease-associated protein [Aminobacter sp. Y103A]|uniref:lysozyme inhibitor LprI family protein n=1 Tax=Aminobacter sp. Y103A TaxID=1870862 RepID=UPI0025725D11|nr:lysozyme inhibitor LprI family protein [Aminobacter sp. SS-2016]BBD39994.1 urease-associated protein [Aminobacter sp. SS-2016]